MHFTARLACAVLAALPLAAAYPPELLRSNREFCNSQPSDYLLSLHEKIVNGDQQVMDKIAKGEQIIQDSLVTGVQSRDSPSMTVTKRDTGDLITLDAWFHVVHDDSKSIDGGYITEAKLREQLNVLNKAYDPSNLQFRMKGFDYTQNSTWAKYPEQYEQELKTKLHQGDSRTLNVYFVPGLGSGGVCRFPNLNSYDDGAESLELKLDGCLVGSFSVPGSKGVFNLGFTAVHEVGHWFGLLHTFQGGCDDKKGDFVADTPAEASPNYGLCPVGRDTCPDIPGLDPVDNFMDYSSDACYETFTPGQTARMRSLLALVRVCFRTCARNPFGQMGLFHAAPASEAGRPSAVVQLGYAEQLPRNRASAAILGMSLAITAVPYGMGSALASSAVYGGGPLSMFVGLLVVVLLDGCVAASLAELASRFPTSSGVYYWSYRLLAPSSSDKKTTRISAAAAPLSYITGWFWLIGNWTIALSVNFGFASLIAATVCLYQPSWSDASAWQLLLVFYALCLLTFLICAVGNALLPYVDGIAAVWNLVTILAVLIVLAATAHSGRHSASFALGHYDSSFSGWGSGFTFFIGLLPPAYTFCAIGMVTSMAEECEAPEVQVPRAMTLCMPLGGVAALLFVLPLCFTLPPQADLLAAPYGQALPYVLLRVLGSRAGAAAVMALVLGVALFCSISITTTASRCTWAFARDAGIPFSGVWSRTTAGQPLAALVLVTVIEMLLGLINLGSTSAFTAFVSVGVIGLAVGYLVPIAISLAMKRKEVAMARWRLRPAVGVAVNVVALGWILFELVLFSMPQALPVTPASMNYASVVFVGFAVVSAIWYCISGRHDFKGPPEESRIE
ncbi:hypothetical protein PWT90_04576 [Aphanocladium album]|nr:hypothetical protein PWT90_04576 [Aphanocladium album]